VEVRGNEYIFDHLQEGASSAAKKKLSKKEFGEAIDALSGKDRIRSALGQDAKDALFDISGGLDPDEFITRLGFSPDANVGVAVYGDSISINSVFEDPIAGTVKLERDFDITQKMAIHDYFKVSKTGGGFSKKILKSSIDLYEEVGIKSVVLQANIDVGGYAWARYGFLMDKDNWNSYRKIIKHEAPSGTSQAVLKLLDSPDPRAMWAIADSPEGKKLLLGKTWNGKLELSNKEQMERFRAYVK